MHNQPFSDDKAILVVEDNLTLQYLVKRQLTRLGHKCEFAASGSEAVQKASSKHYDLILMDVQLPEVSGLDATRCIRERERKANDEFATPIIAVTANPDQKQCYDAGMNDFLFKPVSLDQLDKAVTLWLNKPLKRQ